MYEHKIQAVKGQKITAPLVRQLRLFRDVDTGVITFCRVGGRIHNAKLNFVTKFPMLIPRTHAFKAPHSTRPHSCPTLRNAINSDPYSTAILDKHSCELSPQNMCKL
jgi:hypothetical protein